jgi:hypothetical protein
VFVVSVGKGQEVIETITREAEKRGVQKRCDRFADRCRSGMLCLRHAQRSPAR